ncbi:MAG: response regulator transcription factor [Planctomycetes bacterium]|nr:response regulator transcription factor [Planctomycetota bacterium]
MAAKKVLVVDDEGHVTYLLALKLRQMGYAVSTAGDGEEAYLLACQDLPDLIVTDYQMPVMSGFEMCVKLKETQATSAIPVVMLTARGHRLPPSDLMKTNIQSLMPKPFSLHELLARVTEIIGPATPAAANQPASSPEPSHGA